jgi:hypothetical protein
VAVIARAYWRLVIGVIAVVVVVAGGVRRVWPGVLVGQAYPDQPVVVIDALDRVSVERELADDGGREVNPAGVQLGKSDGLLTGLTQSL